MKQQQNTIYLEQALATLRRVDLDDANLQSVVDQVIDEAEALRARLAQGGRPDHPPRAANHG